MIYKMVRIFVKTFSIMFVIGLYLVINLTIKQTHESEELIYKFGRICGRGALKSFQDESDMSKYSSSSGVMSSEYSEYLRWLSSDRSYTDVVNYLRSGFSDGLTPANFSIPYVDKDKLEVEFNQQLSMYMDTLQAEGTTTFLAVDNIKGSVKSVSKEFQNFNTNGFMYGVNSSFKDNINGHSMLYDYNTYVSYYVVFEVEYDLLNKVTDFFSITNDGRTVRTVEIPVRYELYN